MSPEIPRHTRSVTIALAMALAYPHRAFAQSEPAVSKFPETADGQALYCMQASFGYLSRATRFLALLNENKNEGEALRAKTDLAADDKSTIDAALKRIGADIDLQTKEKELWGGHNATYMNYAQSHKLFDDRDRSVAIPQQAIDDGQAVSEFYRACVRQCADGRDPVCRQGCNAKAEATKAEKQLRSCADLALKFK